MRIQITVLRLFSRIFCINWLNWQSLTPGGASGTISGTSVAVELVITGMSLPGIESQALCSSRHEHVKV
jgi:hypothetical protein